MNKNIFLLVFLSGIIFSSSCFPQRAEIEQFERDIEDMIVREDEDLSIEKLCRSKISPLKAGILLGIVFAGGVKICEGFSHKAEGTFPVKRAGIVGFLVGYALVSIGQYLIL